MPRRRSVPEPRRAETRSAVRNAAWVAAQRGGQLVIGVLFALVVPRLMGPDLFGRYALITSISMWFALLSGIGAVSLMTRSVAPLVERGDEAGVRKLFSGLLTLRAATGVGAASIYLAVTIWWLDEVDLAALFFIAAAVFSRTTANICFALFLGLGRAARWGLGEILRRWLTLIFVIGGTLLDGLRGAAFGFFVAHLLVLAVGLWMSRPYIERTSLRPDWDFLSPFLRMGAHFAGGNLLLALSQRTGETLVHMATGNFVEVGFFGVAFAMYITGAQAAWHVVVSFASLLIKWREGGHHDAIDAFADRLSSFLAVGVVAACLVLALVGQNAMALVLGEPYRPVFPSVSVLAVALIAVAVSSIGRVHALVVNRPGVAGAAAAIELISFWTLGTWLASRYGSLGAAVGVLVGSTLNAGVLAWHFRRHLAAPLRRFGTVVAMASVVAPLAWFELSWPLEVLVLAVAMTAFGGLVVWGGVVSREDYRTLRQALGRDRQPMRL